MLTDDDKKFLELAIAEAKKSLSGGGVPIGAVLVRGNKVIGAGNDRFVQDNKSLSHAAIMAVQNAGRQKTYEDTVLYTTVSPCLMCAGMIIQQGIPRVIVGEDQTYEGHIDFLRSNDVEVELVNESECIALMEAFVDKNPDVMNEEIKDS